MVSEKMLALGSKRSIIREIFEYSSKRAGEIGRENVFDFSLGNPSVPAPALVNETIAELLRGDSVALHGYTSAPGDASVRETIAQSLNRRFGTGFSAANLYMTVGAAASLCAVLRGLFEPGDEYIAMAPFFTEYRVFAEAAGARFVVVPADVPGFQIDLAALEAAITPHTKGVLVNSPNNPSGAVYSEPTIKRLCALLTKKSEEYGRPIFLISAEPYREIAYGVEVPFLTKYYDNTIVCYSYSKSLSLPGERIGWVLVPDAVRESKKVMAALAGAARAQGYVCAPSLFQRVAARCCDTPTDVAAYKKNRDALLAGLTACGFECVPPDGAFYLFVKSPEPDAYAFYERAKQLELLVVPSDDFGVTGYVRIAYCVSYETIERSLPAFRKLAQSYGLKGE
ncbi:MAG: pyridoxal phosphate-dependent aminotransferase [Oscillospiraceae bacterium]|nr:pyridoxal phosphate-dependent aminotransferase [Oscillospiraceae bacterium]